MSSIYRFILLASLGISGAWGAVDINSASKEELDRVKGISPAKAQAIVDYRKERGPFKSIDELKQVKGFGEKSVNKLRQELIVGQASQNNKTSQAK